MKKYKFDELNTAPLIIDAIYESGPDKNIKSEPLHVLLPRTSNQGGFRITLRQDGTKKPAYVVIYTSLEELEWPDYLDAENGLFRYYGDNRHPGNDLHSTKKKGNALLKNVFAWMSDSSTRADVPPFLIFKKGGKARDVQFLGLAAPGNNNIPPDRDLISFWRTMGDERFQNYEAYFTVLDAKGESISKEWLSALIYNHETSLDLAPAAWREFIFKGRVGIKPLRAPKILTIPSKRDQLPDDEEGKQILQAICNFYASNPHGFEKCATAIVQMMDPNFVLFDLTRPWRDGGRDAIGKYRIGTCANPLTIDFALEAKCYLNNSSVGVRQMSRLISRIKYRQFGIMVTTSYIDKQAYSEVTEDGHPILVLCGKDIAHILRSNGIVGNTLQNWLKAIEL